jgi:S-methylmethionine-dependent homocysteine/selenocysteine methylase
MYEHIARKLAAGASIIIDGGTGTDLQRRGAVMSGDTWCADANLTHPALVREVHADYIRAGAEIITANTFASSALLFNALGRDNDLIEIDRVAVALAREAVAGQPVAVAGSVSTMRPVFTGSDRTSTQREWPEQHARALFRRKAETLVQCGVDLLMMEMMRDTDYSVWATEAAIATGVPVWVGISVEKNTDGVLTGFGREDMRLDDVARALAATGPAVVSIMHTSPSDTDEAIAVVRTHWKGPLGVYPESGYFRMPEWTFVDIIPPEELVDRARAWRARGVSIFGGCCGLGPEHIDALHKAFTP